MQNTLRMLCKLLNRCYTKIITMQLVLRNIIMQTILCTLYKLHNKCYLKILIIQTIQCKHYYAKYITYITKITMQILCKNREQAKYATQIMFCILHELYYEFYATKYVLSKLYTMKIALHKIYCVHDANYNVDNV